MAFEQRVELEVNGVDLVFNLNVTAYNKYQNSTSMVNKVQPATNFLMAVVDDNSRPELKKMIQAPGAALHIAAAVVDEYQPEFNITVKKSNSEQKKSATTD
jgi:hypothetical protein